MLFLATIMGEREWEQGPGEEEGGGKLRIYNGAQGERIRNKQGAKEEEGKPMIYADELFARRLHSDGDLRSKKSQARMWDQCNALIGKLC